MQSQTPNQIIGVLAHETGHIAGGHCASCAHELANAQTAAILGMLLGVGAMAAGARAAAACGGKAGAAIIGAASMAMRSLLSYQRQQEERPTAPA